MPETGRSRPRATLSSLVSAHAPALLATILAAAAVIAPGPSAAQDARWYRVELLVFKHLPGDRTETFEATPRLAYPDEFRFLVDPQRVAANRAQFPGRDYITGNGRQVFEAPVDAPAAPQVLPDEEQRTALPAAFLLAPASAQDFRGKAAYMQRSGRYEILFHESWVQPVVGERAALPIILDRSGDSDAWPQLQGSVKLYLSRYLHLETDLWLNTQGDYLGDSGWQMPAPPRAPQSLIVEVAETAPEPQEDDGLPGGPEPAAGAPDAAMPAVDPAEEEADPRTLYPWRHAVALAQKRRMRSGEIHYIDHPLLGVVARLTPLAPDEVEALQPPEDPSAATLTGDGVAAAQ